MVKKSICGAVLFLLLAAVSGFCGEKEDLFVSVEALNIQRQGYTLCGKLTPEQEAHARKNMEKANSGKVYRFRDGNLNIVADQESHRVLVMFEQFGKVGQEEVQNLVGDLFTAYGEPTVSVQDRFVYWAWGRKEKVTTDRYTQAREQNKQLEIIATAKLNSEVKIMEKGGDQTPGDAYYIISSDPLLPYFKDE